MENTSWKGIYILSAIINAVLFVIIQVCYPTLSIRDEFKNGNDDTAIFMIKKFYKYDSEDQIPHIANHIREEVKAQQKASGKGGKINLIEAFCGEQYRRCSWNGIVVAFGLQFTGQPVVLLSSVHVFKSLIASGSFNISLTVALNIMNFVNMCSSFAGNVMVSRLGMRKSIIVGHSIMTACLAGLIVCFYINFSAGILVVLLVNTVFREMTTAPLSFMHIFETCHESTVGFLNLIVFLVQLLASVTHAMLSKKLNTAEVFMIWSSLSFLAVLYYIFFLRDTSFKEELVEEVEMEAKPLNKVAIDQEKAKKSTPKMIKVKTPLSFQEKQELYWPNKFKTSVEGNAK